MLVELEIKFCDVYFLWKDFELIFYVFLIKNFLKLGFFVVVFFMVIRKFYLLVINVDEGV